MASALSLSRVDSELTPRPTGRGAKKRAGARQPASKFCTGCQQDLPESAFYRSVERRLQGKCKRCHDAQTRRWGKANPGRVALAYKRHALKRRYGITLEAFERRVEAQGGACAICGRPFTAQRLPHVDHCHTTHVVRGVLCGSCNPGLGRFGDDPFRLRKAAEYLEAQRLTPTQRAHYYNKTFAQYPASHLSVTDDRWVTGMWMLGNNYKSGAKGVDGTPFYGAYPPGYIKRVMALFPDAKRVLHLFAGSLPASGDYARFGNVLVPGPNGAFDGMDFEGDAHRLSEFYPAKSFDLVLADPPYSKDDAKRYGTEMIDRRKVLYQVYEVLAPGGSLVWLDTVLPLYRADYWRLWGTIGIVRSTNHRYRQVAIFERLSDDARVIQKPLPLDHPAEFTEEGASDEERQEAA